jgi:hypothetical protein
LELFYRGICSTKRSHLSAESAADDARREPARDQQKAVTGEETVTGLASKKT